ncbi:MAG: hypothetical protein LBJ64_05560 [Deltaproteobacteria bacterium]|jgi:electron transfer flavoprotein alpha/beta subunit|nr:hypothetical protein [Deltaproteobacteria bacterium]
MRVYVFYKIVPELSHLTESDWRTGTDLRPEERYVRRTINPGDESALEMALRLRDQNAPNATELWAMTIGGDEAERPANSLRALGFERAVIIESDLDLRFRPELTAAVLARQVQDAQDALVVAGSRSADGENSLTPWYLAEILGWPVISEVLSVAVSAPGSNVLEVESLSDDGLLWQKVALPVVLAVGDAPSTFLRTPTLKDRLTRGQGKPEKIRLEPELASGLPPLTRLTALERPCRRREGRVVDQGDAAEKAEILLETLVDWGL